MPPPPHMSVMNNCIGFAELPLREGKGGERQRWRRRGS